MSARPRLLLPAVTVGLAASLALVGCGSSSKSKGSTPSTTPAPSTSAPAAPTKLALTVSKAGVVTGFPATLTAGLYDLTETPDGANAEASVSIVRLGPGYTKATLLQDVGAAFSDKPDKAAVTRLYSKASFLGGPSGFGTQEAMVALPAGSYVYADPDTDGAPVTGTFTVTGDLTGALPTTATTITASGDMNGMYHFTVDGSLDTSGMITFKNASQTNAHFLELAKLKPGKTFADCDAYNGDPTAAASPCTPVVDGAIVSAGASEVVDIKAAGPGSYVLACYMPDPATGVPHAMEGMTLTKTET